jgi:hypothetical protein
MRVMRSIAAALLCTALSGVAAHAQPTAEDLGLLTTPTTLAPAAAVGPGEIKWYRFQVPEVVAPVYLDMTLSATGFVDTEMALYTVGGTLIVTDDDDGPGNFSSLTFGARCATRPNGNGLVHDGRDGATLGAGIYYLAVGQFNMTFGPIGWNVTSASTGTGTITTTINLGQTTPVTPPPSIDLGILGLDTMYADQFEISPGAVRWYTFEIPEIRRLENFLDIGTIGTVDVNTVIALYGSDGQRIGLDDEDGPGSFSSLSYGEPCSNRGNIATGLSPGVPFDGRDGATLAAGRYYLAISGAATSFAPCFTASTAHTRAGTVVIRIELDTPPPNSGIPPAGFNELGQIYAGRQGVMADNSAITGGVTRWFRFTTAESADDETQKYLDIHTYGSFIPDSSDANDTYIALYAANGSRVAVDDDDSYLSSSQLSFGYGAARDGMGPDPGTGQDFRGQDGSLPEGTYYLAVTVYNAASTYPLCNFDIFDASTANGTMDLVINTNLSDGVVCGSADFNGDGDVGTDADIEAFFACLSGDCCPTCGSADFDDNGDTGTDADIEAFFRVLAGGTC